ncbi:MAG: hypothetical protein EYC70_01570 [Planctomycetota bacterium]|nr:MAG: hypothetical protein EYC70_01570 [Planctomycetota bacterium]
MRRLPVLLLCGLSLIIGALVYAVLAAGGGRSTAPSAAPAEDPTVLARLQRMEQELARNAEQMQRLRQELDLALARPRDAGAAARPLPVRADTGEGERDPRWYLDQYVLSFRNGGRGSEYFRLAVEAYADVLLEDIAACIHDTGEPAALRRNLIAMLGDGRFAGSERVVAILLQVLRLSSEESLADASLAALGAIGRGTSAAAGLEALAWTLPWPELQRGACQRVVELLARDANAALLRLLGSAPDTAARQFLVGLVQADDLDAALSVFQYASNLEQPVRLAAAQVIGEYRSDAIRAFIDRWRARETDPEVREALGVAQQTQSTVPAWSAEQMVGPPDSDPMRDNPKAWASSGADMGMQWIQLGYASPLRASAVRIFEVNVAGAVVEVIAIDENGATHTLWSGVDPLHTPGVFEVSFPATSYRVSGLRILLDTDRGQGWNEIDAVELVGPDGRAWASSASASSSYASGRRAKTDELWYR